VLDDLKTNASYLPGQILFSQGEPCDGLYSVLSGVVSIRKTDVHGRTVLVRLRHPGETMGYRDFFAGSVFTTSAEALAPTRVCFIRAPAVRSLLVRNPSLGLRFLEQVSHDLQNAEETILQSASLSARARLAHLLLTLKERHGSVGDDGDLRITLPLSRQDIADLLGTRPETIARVINALEKDGVAVFSGRMVIVPDLDALLDEIEPAEGP